MSAILYTASFNVSFSLFNVCLQDQIHLGVSDQAYLMTPSHIFLSLRYSELPICLKNLRYPGMVEVTSCARSTRKDLLNGNAVKK